MPTVFPITLDVWTNPTGADDTVAVDHALQHDNHNDAIAALETKVGINSSADTNSLDYKISHIATYAADESTLHLAAGSFSIKSTYVGQASITTLGTVTTGTWNATPISPLYLQQAPADLGNADVTVDLSNSHAGKSTSLIIDGALTVGSNIFDGGGGININVTAGFGVSVLGGTFANSFSVAATNTTTVAVVFGLNSTGTPAAGFGSEYHYQLKTSTTLLIDAHSDVITWVDATHATRKARVQHNVYDTASREYMRGEASGSAAMIGFLGASAVVRQTGDIGTALVNLGLMSGTPTTPGGWDAAYEVTGSNFTTSSLSLVDITGMVSGTLNTGANYEFEAVIQGQSSTTAGMKFGVHVGGTGSPTGNVFLLEGITTAVTDVNVLDTALANSFGTASTNGIAIIKGFITTGTGTPTLSIRVQKTTSGTAQVNIGSILKIKAL